MLQHVRNEVFGHINPSLCDYITVSIFIIILSPLSIDFSYEFSGLKRKYSNPFKYVFVLCKPFVMTTVHMLYCNIIGECINPKLIHLISWFGVGTGRRWIMKGMVGISMRWRMTLVFAPGSSWLMEREGASHRFKFRDSRFRGFGSSSLSSNIQNPWSIYSRSNLADHSPLPWLCPI